MKQRKVLRVLILVIYIISVSISPSQAFFKKPLTNFIASLVFLGGGVGAYLQGEHLIKNSNSDIEKSNLYKVESRYFEDIALQAQYDAGVHYGKFLEGGSSSSSDLALARSAEYFAAVNYNQSIKLSNQSYSLVSNAQTEAEQGGIYKGSGLVSATIGTCFLINGFVKLHKKKNKAMVKNNIELFASSNLIDSRIGIKYRF